jgi:hypothetical protein
MCHLKNVQLVSIKFKLVLKVFLNTHQIQLKHDSHYITSEKKYADVTQLYAVIFTALLKRTQLKRVHETIAIHKASIIPKNIIKHYELYIYMHMLQTL